MLTRAIQWQRDELRRDPSGDIERLISGSAIIYGHEEMSKEKRTNYLEAEFPYKWGDIKKLLGGGTEYNRAAIQRLYGRQYQDISEDLISMGVLERTTRKGEATFSVPFLYRRGLDCTQRFVGS
jgi:hypothetical protein